MRGCFQQSLDLAINKYDSSGQAQVGPVPDRFLQRAQLRRHHRPEHDDELEPARVRRPRSRTCRTTRAATSSSRDPSRAEQGSASPPAIRRRGRYRSRRDSTSDVDVAEQGADGRQLRCSTARSGFRWGQHGTKVSRRGFIKKAGTLAATTAAVYSWEEQNLLAQQQGQGQPPGGPAGTGAGGGRGGQQAIAGRPGPDADGQAGQAADQPVDRGPQPGGRPGAFARPAVDVPAAPGVLHRGEDPRDVRPCTRRRASTPRWPACRPR